MRSPDCQTATTVFCDTAAKCQSAAATLGACPVLVLDCEGHNLGVYGGRLSVIVLRTATPDARTYLIDVPNLSPADLQPVLDLLCSPTIRKVVFDGRMDFSALHHHALRAELHNVLDLQLVDVMSRFARGETGETQQRRRSFVSQIGRAAHAPAVVRAGPPAEQSGRVHRGARGRPEKGRETDQDERQVQVRTTIAVFVV